MTNAQLYSTEMQTQFSVMAFVSCQNSWVGDTSMNFVLIKNEKLKVKVYVG